MDDGLPNNEATTVENHNCIQDRNSTVRFIILAALWLFFLLPSRDIDYLPILFPYWKLCYQSVNCILEKVKDHGLHNDQATTVEDASCIEDRKSTVRFIIIAALYLVFPQQTRDIDYLKRYLYFGKNIGR